MTSLALTCLFVLAPLASAQQTKLLGQADLSTGCGGPGPLVPVTHTIRFLPSPILFEEVISDENEDELTGLTLVWDASSGSPFVQLVELLTNGVVDRIARTSAFGSGGCQATSRETIFDFSGLACPNGIDFQGATIERIELRLDSVCFGPKPGLGPASLTVDAVLSVYGHDPAPCLPPRFYVRLQPNTPASAAPAVTLLGEAQLSSGCGTSAGPPGALFTVGFKPQPSMFHALINEENADQFAGQTRVLDETDGSPFVQAVELLTNGAPDKPNEKTSWVGGGSCESYTFSEALFYDITGLACPNGIDFQGAEIERIELRLDTVCFGIKSGSFTTLQVEGALSVYGRDLAPCVPPRFQVRVQPSIPESNALRGELVTDPAADALWRLWVDHSAFVPDAAQDVLVVSRRPLKRATPFGTLLADPSPDALILLRSGWMPGQAFELTLPVGALGLGTLHAQAGTIDAAGRVRLTNALDLAQR